ncbi:PQQ-binding-like beta-propeller repeat protein [Rhodococcus sp. RD6.2]|uniref:outer membrane protein assembly factor BamB family protein n=1 Tax=Rhodococcus sp. RD6.2 TaxID=260936 RepID=UPI000A77FFF3|nr:PQQ-binding-like beta-propeller repeat protein [Rhodococcus sp. RD6.2]
MTTERRRLLVAALVAAVTVTGAVVVVARSGGDSERDPVDPAWVGTEFPTPTAAPEPTASAGAPVLAWSLDAAEVYGRAFAQFRDPRYGTEFDWDSPGFIEAGDTVVTAIGLPDPRGYSLDETMFVGVDTGDGTVRWRTPVGTLGGCAEILIKRELVCHRGIGEHALAVVNVDSGALTEMPVPDEWSIFGIAADGDRVVVVEGNPEDNDVEVHAGPPAAPGSAWTSRFDIGDVWESVAEDAVIQVEQGVGVIAMGGDVVGFDPATGRQTWSRGLPECVGDPRIAPPGLVVVTRSGCDDGESRGFDVIDRFGRSLVTTDTGSPGRVLVDESADGMPLVVGGAAHDRESGEMLWRSDELDGSSGVAVTDRVVVVRGREAIGVDPDAGRILWRTELDEDAESLLRGGDGLVVVGSRVLTGIDPETGRIRWTLPPDAVGTGDSLSGASVGLAGGRLILTGGRAMVGLT